jgi:hypothetical protein
MKQLTNNTKPIIVSFASKGREDYNKGQQRLLESILKHWDGDYWLHSLERDGELPSSKMFEHKPHNEVPYLFKFTMIQLAREMGYTKIIWLDSSLVLDRNPIELLDVGVMAFNNLGHPLYKYISDHAVANLNCVDRLIVLDQTWGGAIGFDFNREWVQDLFSDIINQSLLGSFNDGTSTRYGFIAHRHDQAVMSVLFSDYAIALYPYGYIVTHPHYITKEYGDQFYISHRPIL